jgi:hypothetical protein
MRDADVRQVLRDRLQATAVIDDGARLVEELGLSMGSVRADMAVVNGILKGYEIKSEQDTLARLKVQASLYSQVFDTVTLVVAERHLKKAARLVPDWWGIEVASVDQSSSAVELNPVRDEQLNSEVDAFTLAQLLWRDEVLSILRNTGGAPALSSKPRAFLWKSLAEAMPLCDLKAAVRLALKNRKGWRSDELQTPDDGMFLPSAMSSGCQSRSVRQRSRKFSHRPN